MTEQVYRGDEIEYIVTKAEGINEWSSVSWFWNGNEINASDLEIVIYNDEEQQ